MKAAHTCMATAHAYVTLYGYQNLSTKYYDFDQITLEKPPIILMTENKSTVRLSINDMMKKGTIHIARCFCYVKEGTRSGIHTVQYCKVEEMLAESATKSQISSESKPQLTRAIQNFPKHLMAQYGHQELPKGSEDKLVAYMTEQLLYIRTKNYYAGLTIKAA